MTYGTRAAVLALQIPIAAEASSRPGWQGYLGWGLGVAIFALLVVMTYHRFHSLRKR